MKKFFGDKFSFPHFLYLLPVFFVFHGYVENREAMRPGEGFGLLGEYMLATVLIFGTAFLLFRSRKKAAIFTFCIMFFHFFFGVFHDALKKIIPGTFIVKYSFILPTTFVILIFLIIILHKTKRSFTTLTYYLNLLLLVLLLIEIPGLVFALDKKDIGKYLTDTNPCDTCEKPDIYFIIADEYAGNRELKEVLGFDNSSFEKALEQRGFYIAKNSKSNYNYTPYSLASILGTKYLENISSKSNDIKNRKASYQQINDNDLIRFLKQYNYQFINLSLFDFAGKSAHVDNMFFLRRKKMLTAQTFTSRLKKDIGFNLVTRFKMKSEINRLIYSTLKNNQKILDDTYTVINQTSSAPRFIYTHLMMPHYPYYFNASGQPSPLASLMEEHQQQQNNYIGYLRYCNKIFLQLIDAILQKSKKPPIIIFMGDHGFCI